MSHRHYDSSSSCLSRFFARKSLLLVLLCSQVTTVVQAQLSCSAPESITSPFSMNSESLPEINDFVYSASWCSTTLSESDLPPGRWFSYIPSEVLVARLSIEALEEFSFPPEMIVFKGTCDSLVCINGDNYFREMLFQTTVGDEYFIFVYGPYDEAAYLLSFEEYGSPANDKMESAVALAQDDLPFQGDFTLQGALSDFTEDACALDGEYGVWFTYTTTFPAELVILKTTTRNYLAALNVIGVQARAGDAFFCVTVGDSSEKSVEWTAEANVQYYILIGDPKPQSDGTFELTLQSRGLLPSPPLPAAPQPAPETSPVLAPIKNEELPAPETAPVVVPDTSGEAIAPENSPITAPESSPTSEAGRSVVVSGVRGGVLMMGFLVFL
ncbi:hypothetical protein FisN_5Hu120 [Fistulifera solaris]|uniref:Ig-like domain-containing protein n=1 Tax=Fistulifera solaris TaxID=1519565 RepID=A0A1Z5JU64_FISSO|nr:hypothetical protein FisN_5Hu120 [Fistulifera solaris]|eukprot:GAX17469.1 hypothetical protein FisN_5Hu120 [Fistulifera solaris]